MENEKKKKKPCYIDEIDQLMREMSLENGQTGSADRKAIVTQKTTLYNCGAQKIISECTEP